MPQVAAPLEEVVDESPSCCFFLAHGLSLCAFVAFGERVEGLGAGCDRVVQWDPGPDRAGAYLCQVSGDQAAKPHPRLVM